MLNKTTSYMPLRNINRFLSAPKPALNQPTREWLLAQLYEVIELCMKKIKNRRLKEGERIRWARILVHASQACNSVLTTKDIDELKERLNALEREAELASTAFK